MFKRKIGALIACATLMASASACSGVNTAATNAGSDNKTVTLLTVAGYDDVVALNGLWQQLFQEHGYTLQTKQADLAAGYSGVARGDMDGFVDAWLPSTHGTYVDKYKDKLLIPEQPFYGNDRLVLVAPKSVPENTISEVVANAEKYGSKVVGIEAGSGEMRILPDVLAKYGATDKLKIVAGSTPATLATLKDAAANNKPVVATLWQPHWAFTAMDIKVLEDDLSGWPKPDGSYVVFNKDYASKNPEVVKWMTNMKLTDEQFSTLMAEVSKTPSNPVDGAKKWLENPDNRKTVDSWFN
ncbi:glycine betaine ABC transporter substrate-binding protein [Paenarthrobacter sp. NPDC058040]|uniref:glycine betaine ABC transporter substrate-binding protein n=1 Tax=unclassified Paenarthrobacter TaxID=2634190 RepID=UPI0036DC4A35